MEHSVHDDPAAALQALQDSEYRYRNLFQAMAASFWELDFSGIGAMLRQLKADGIRDFPAHFARHPDFVRDMMRATRVLDVNDKTVALFGRGDKSELLCSLEPFWPDTSAGVFAASVIAAIGGQPSFSAECKLLAIDGREVDALFTACFPPKTVANGKLLIGVIDISARVRAEKLVQKIQADFAHAARVSMLGELTASIAHEVNQPLTAIATGAAAGLRWLNRPQPDLDEVRAITARIVEDVTRAASILSRIRDMAMYRAPERAPIALNGLIEDATIFLRHELQGHGVRLELDLAADLPPVLADRTQLQQVVVNLAINAVQAMTSHASGPRRLVIRSARDDAGLRVVVEDSGPGFAGPARTLFESFFTTKDSGMGMGLPICRTIVESHGGRIDATNRAGGGACFFFTLPAAETAPVHHT